MQNMACSGQALAGRRIHLEDRTASGRFWHNFLARRAGAAPKFCGHRLMRLARRCVVRGLAQLRASVPAPSNPVLCPRYMDCEKWL